MSLLIPITLNALKIWTYLYELVTWPIYLFFQRDVNLIPITETEDTSGIILSKPVNENDPYSPWRNLNAMNSLSETMIQGCETLDELFIRACKKWPESRCFGTRKLIKSEMEPQANGKLFKKLTFEKYYWETYSDVNKRIDNLGRGLLKLGVRPGKDRVVIYAETRAEWMIAAQTCFRFNVIVVTLYSTLGEDAVMHGIEESEVSVVITSVELLPKVRSVVQACPSVQHVVYMDHGIFGGDKPQTPKEETSADRPYIHAMSQLERDAGMCRQDGSGDELEPSTAQYKPSRNSLAMIMYTSGSTGKPKGVMMTHSNIMSAMAGQYEGLPAIQTRDIYIGYLPLAHVLELCCENVLLAVGIPVGYSSPLTMTDNGSKIKAGTKGDITVLKPTLMACVPTILERITKSVWEKATDQGPLFLEMFRWAYNYKSSRMDRGYPSLFMDRLVFKKIKKLLGGRVRYMLSGGAPLTEEAQNFINICFCPIIQGYGLTETCGAGTLMVDRDRRVGQVGPPLSSVQLRLRDWPEGGYSPSDKPKPRGEVLIGGGSVSAGYFNKSDTTVLDAETDFFVDEQGQRWFCSGDIGMLHLDGSLSIIDRKKDLVKLQGGEYISLARVEMAIMSCAVVESVCIIADSTRDFVVCIVSPKKKQLLQLTEKLNLHVSEHNSDNGEEHQYQSLCRDPMVVAELLRAVQQVCRDKRLERMEIPTRIHLDPAPWTPDSGLVTDALKLKRRAIQDRFQGEISAMYG